MRRRDFIKGLVCAATGWPLTAHAQQPTLPIVGYLSSRGATEDAPFVAAFHRGLNETGYVQERNVAMKYRFADNQYGRLPTLAGDLVRLGASVLMSGGAPSAPAALKALTTSLPIVFVTGGDPVAAGLVASLDRPGGNLTGVNVMNTELSAKRVQLLHEMKPSAGVIAALVNPYNPNAESQLREFQTAADTVGLRLQVVNASTEAQLDGAFATAVKVAGGLVIGADAFLNGQSGKLGTLALGYSIPAISSNREFATAGGLMSYGTSIAEAFRLAGTYVGRILKGEKPADLPVQQSTKVELIINLKTAKALDIDVPPTLLATADEVIE